MLILVLRNVNANVVGVLRLALLQPFSAATPAYVSSPILLQYYTSTDLIDPPTERFSVRGLSGSHLWWQADQVVLLILEQY